MPVKLFFLHFPAHWLHCRINQFSWCYHWSGSWQYWMHCSHCCCYLTRNCWTELWELWCKYSWSQHSRLVSTVSPVSTMFPGPVTIISWSVVNIWSVETISITSTQCCMVPAAATQHLHNQQYKSHPVDHSLMRVVALNNSYLHGW